MPVWIELDGWKSRLRFSACHLIPGHPTCGRLHGHTYAVSVRVEGEREDEFIVDFIELKDNIRGICDRMDHRVILARDDPRIVYEEHEAGYLIVEIVENEKIYIFPHEDVAMLPIDSVSAESLSEYIAHELAPTLPNNATCLEVRVDEGVGQGAGYTLTP